jgi:hypothetical protein
MKFCHYIYYYYLAYLQTKFGIHIICEVSYTTENMSYLFVLVLFLALITLTLARNHNHQIQEENAESNIVLIGYSPSNPQKSIALDYISHSGHNQQWHRQRKLGSRSRPPVVVPGITPKSPGRPHRPPR